MILIANIGSTSFKHRLFAAADGGELTELAKGSVDRIGGEESACVSEIGSARFEAKRRVEDHAQALGWCLERLTDPESGCLSSIEDVTAIGFKAVHAGDLSAVVPVDDAILSRMDALSAVAPAHNPPYAKAMRQLRAAYPDIPLVAAFEPDFHRSIPEEHRVYAIPFEWRAELGIEKWGFHGASHRYIAQRTAQLTRREDLRVVSCHLGGSGSLCAINAGKSVFTTMGMSPQSGLPQSNRVGDFDPFALPWLMKRTGKSLDEILDTLANRSGLLGISGVSGDIRDLEEAASSNPRADLALKVFSAEIKRHLGGCLALMGGIDVLVFTGGIGGNSRRVRSDVCAGMEWAGIVLDAEKNASPAEEDVISMPESNVEIRVIPTNEEAIVAGQTLQLLKTDN